MCNKNASRVMEKNRQQFFNQRSKSFDAVKDEVLLHINQSLNFLFYFSAKIQAQFCSRKSWVSVKNW